MLPESVELRQVKYLNNLIEQDHRFIKRLVKPGLGFFSVETAGRTLQGYEVTNMIRKGQVIPMCVLTDNIVPRSHASLAIQICPLERTLVSKEWAKETSTGR
jgi:hypothetical protein